MSLLWGWFENIVLRTTGLVKQNPDQQVRHVPTVAVAGTVSQGVNLPPTLIFDYPSVAAIAEFIASRT
eukprot:1594923-Amphidinium_carterae.1